jgi:serine/threonine protein kinase
MSPEQARGATVDYRSDQFAFGLILYEMASGKQAFRRDTAVQTLSAILTEEAPPLDAGLPVPLRWMIARCLAKDPNSRYISTSDLHREIVCLRGRCDPTARRPTASRARSARANPARPGDGLGWCSNLVGSSGTTNLASQRHAAGSQPAARAFLPADKIPFVAYSADVAGITRSH